MGKTKRKIHIRERLANTLDLPLDAFLDITRITMLSDKDLLIENYDGLYLYSDNEITVTAEGKRLTVLGSGLVITGAFGGRMVITGTIRSVSYSDD